MKKLKIVAVACVAVVMGLASCKKEDDTANVGGDTSVKIQILRPESVASRSQGGKVGDGEFLLMKPGDLFFVTGDGVIDRHIGIGTVATPSTNGSVQITIEDIESGEAVITGVSRYASLCYIICGLPTTGNQEGGNISAILSQPIFIQNINDTPSTVNKVPLFGQGAVTMGAGSTSGNSTNYGATVDVRLGTNISRLQIGQISAKDYVPTNGDPVTKITAFTVAGIYINNTYTQAPVNGAAPALETYLFDAGQIKANYANVAPGLYVNAATVLQDQIADPNGDGAGTPLNIRPTTGAIWAYNLFPLTIPHVVIHLATVSYQTGTDTPVDLTDQYLTLGSYRAGNSAGAPVTAFKGNNVYTLSDIQFSYSDLSDTPEIQTVDVLVEIEMLAWKDNPIVWDN